jgi:pyruvate/2-oxoglutarate dehydrogenase complex dihydrolipoamide dehydrogenase (E3) component
MAAEEKQQVIDALETLLSITETSGNLRKDLKNDIHISVNILRKSFSYLIHQVDKVKEEYNRYREEAKKATKNDITEGHSQPTRQVVPSLDHTQQSQITGAQQIMASG